MHFWYQVGNFGAKSDVLSLFLVLQTTEFVAAVENNSKKKWTSLLLSLHLSFSAVLLFVSDV